MGLHSDRSKMFPTSKTFVSIGSEGNHECAFTQLTTKCNIWYMTELSSQGGDCKGKSGISWGPDIVAVGPVAREADRSPMLSCARCIEGKVPKNGISRNKTYYKTINVWALLPSELKRLMPKTIFNYKWKQFYRTILNGRWYFYLSFQRFLNTNWKVFIKLTLVSIFNFNLYFWVDLYFKDPPENHR